MKVYQSFSIRDKLKSRGYKYSSLEQANTMRIESYYYLCVSNCYDHRDYLKENGFSWNGYGVKKAWVKKIPMQSLQKEEAMLLHLANVKVKVQPKNNKIV